MDAFDMIAEPILFAQQLHEHSRRIHQSVELIRPLVEALLAEDQEKIKTLQEQMSGLTAEASRIEVALLEQSRHMQFHSAPGSTFSQYLACEDKIAEAAQQFAGLLASRPTTIPHELHADFRAFVTQVVDVCTRAMMLAESLSSPPDSTPPVVEAQNTVETLQAVIEGNRQAKQLGMKLAQSACRQEELLGPVTILFLDKYCTTLHEAAANAEHAANYLRLMIR